MGYRRFAVTVVTLASFVAAQIPTSAFAQSAAQAEVLFKEGQQLIAQQKYAEACQRLVASYKLDPQPNTELLEGLCYSKQGKTASAYNAFIDAASTLPKGGDAQKYAADQAHTLEAQLLKVRVQFQPVVPAGMQMHFDDENRPRDKDFVGIDIALDPGEHDLYATAPGKHDYTKHFTLDASSSPKTLIVNMTDKTKEELAAEHPQTGGGQVIIEKPETSWSTVKTLGLITMIVGGAGLVVGGILLGADLSNVATAGTNQPSQCTTQKCTDALNAAKIENQVGLGIIIPGGVLVVAGIIMFVVGGNVTKAPEKPASASVHFLPWLGPQTAGMGVVGTF